MIIEVPEDVLDAARRVKPGLTREEALSIVRAVLKAWPGAVFSVETNLPAAFLPLGPSTRME